MSTQSVQGVQIPSGLLVNGRWVPGRGPRLDTINPATEEVITTVSPCAQDKHAVLLMLLSFWQIDTASSEDVDDAVKSARNAFENTWGTNVSAQRRGQLVYALAGEIERRLDDLATLECVDSGKPISCTSNI